MGVADRVRRLSRPARRELVVGGEAPLRARVPGEVLEHALSRILPEARGERAVAKQLPDPLAKLGGVARVDEEARLAVEDDLGKAADPARDHRGSARHRLDRGEAEELGDGDLTSIAGALDRREDEHLRAAVEVDKVLVRDRAEELDAPTGGEAPEERGVVALRPARVVPFGAHHAERDVVGDGGDQPVDPLVRRDSPDEEHALTGETGIGAVSPRVGAPVDDPRSRRRRTEVARRIGRHREEAVEQPRQEPEPASAAEAVIRDGRTGPARASDERRDPARRGAHVMGVDDVGGGESGDEPGRDRVRGMPAEMRERPQDADAEPARIAPRAGAGAERDELGLDVSRERARELERVALAAAEDPVGAEERRRDVDDPHPDLVLPLLTLGDPNRLSGGYLYHLRMAEAAPVHGARVVFLSFPDRAFPLGAVSGPAIVRRATSLGASALLVDSIVAALAWPALSRARLRVPVVGVLHQPPGGIDHGAVRTRLQAPCDLRMWRRADLLIAASDHLAEQLAAAALREEQIRVVPPGRDVAPPPLDALPDLRRERGVGFLCVANWLPRKGIVELLDAVARLPHEAGTLHLVGDTDVDPRYAARVRARIANPALADRVVVHGRRSREEVASLYAAADVFVLPAFREPYGTVWGEAMAFGLPVVGWRLGNLPYLADDEGDALLVAPGDVAGLARALARLAGDEPLRRRLGDSGRRRALSRPTWSESATLFFDVVRYAVGGRQR